MNILVKVGISRYKYQQKSNFHRIILILVIVIKI